MNLNDADAATLRRWIADRQNAPLRPVLERRLAEVEAGSGLVTKTASEGPPRARKSSNGAISGEVINPHRIEVPPGGYRLTIRGAPRTKKNSLRRLKVDGQVKSIPSAAWCAWRDAALPQIPAGMLPDQPYNCRALFYRDRACGDATGYHQGLADVLEEAGVLSNDRLIEAWDGSRLLKDAGDPRVEIVLTPLEP